MSVKLNLCKVNLLLNAEIKRVNKFSDKINDNKYNKIIKGDQIKKFNNELNLLYEYHKRETEKKEKLKLLNSLKKKSKFSFLMIDNEKDVIKDLGYKKIKEVGEGAFGKVYLCEKNKKKYAIKLQIFHKKSWHAKNIESFIKQRLNEYKIAKKIGSVGIGPKIYDTMFFYDEMKDKFINLIIMEFIKGKELCKYENKKKLNEDEKKRLQLKIDKLHKLKIYHKDLHKCNIMVTKKNGKLDFIIVDFGLAREQKNVIKNLKKDNKEFEMGWWRNDDEDKSIDKVLYISIYNLLKNKKIIVNC